MNTKPTNERQAESKVDVWTLIASIVICQMIMIAAIIVTATDFAGAVIG